MQIDTGDLSTTTHDTVERIGPAGGLHAQPVLWLYLVGAMAVVDQNGANLRPSGRKTLGLLAILALSSKRRVRRAWLAETLWSTRPEEQARASLRQEIHRLLHVLGPLGPDVLDVGRDTLCLRPGACWLDTEALLTVDTHGEATHEIPSADLLENLQGVDPAFDIWLAGQRESFGLRARDLCERVLREQTIPERTIAAAQRLLSVDRTHEGAWRGLISSYAARGDRGMATMAYQRCQHILLERFNAVPSAETQKLMVDIAAGGLATPTVPAAIRREPVARAPVPAEPPAETALPRLGALPMRLIDVASGETHLSIEVARDVTAALRPFSALSAESAIAVARLFAQTQDERTIQQELGLSYLLDGTIQRHGATLRLQERLIDLRGGSELVWSGRFDCATFDCATGDELAPRPRLAARVAAHVAFQVASREAGIAAATRGGAGPRHMTLWARAITSQLRAGTFGEAGALLREAMARQPDNAQCHAWAAYWQVLLVDQGWAPDASAATALASELAGRATALDPHCAEGFVSAGLVNTWLLHRPYEAALLLDHALALNPALPVAWGVAALTQGCLGDLHSAETYLQRYDELAAADDTPLFCDAARVLVALLRRDFATAVSIGRAVQQLSAGSVTCALLYLCALGHAGERLEAEQVGRTLRALRPDLSIASIRLASPLASEAHLDLLIEGLVLAGLA